MNPTIAFSVGRSGVNRNPDVKIVQQLLNTKNLAPLALLKDDGICGTKTFVAIEEFQRRVLKMVRPDGRVDPGGRTFQALAGKLPGTPVANKPFLTRVDEFRAHAQKEFGISISVSSDMRDAVWQQRMHVAHMIKYNSFAGLKPKAGKAVGTRNLIDIAHLKDAKVAWVGGVTPEEFLRDKNGLPCTKKADQSGYDPEPDETKTRVRALEILTAGGVATAKDRASEPHSAMVAPGVQGCGEPCACGGNRSRHLAGMAVDLNQNALTQLKQKLSPPTDGQLDKLLAEFHLKRPMPTEPWHIEPQV